jgi:hypothetical protein
MIAVDTAHTADLDERTLSAARALLEEVFAGELTSADWEHALGGVHALAWEDGALGAADAAADFYLARGWVRWRGPTAALTPAGVVRTAQEDGAIFVLPGSATLDLAGELMCDWRDGEVW